MRALNRPKIAATRIQALWRGYVGRQMVAEKKKREIAMLEDHWRHYDAKYRSYVVAQNLLVELKKNDPTWDPTQTIYYRWMLEEGGPWIEEAEHEMMKRGWVRPETELNVPILKELLVGVMQHCGFEEEDARALLSIVATFRV
jgi:hypothetical protein